MRANWSFRRGSIGLIAICLLVLASASVEQHAVGWNELSHFAQIRAFANGTPRIDRWAHTTGDRAFYQGHYYGDKAPGLAFLLTPVYWVSRHLVIHNDSYGQLHLMVLVGCGLPFLILMLLAWREVEARYPGTGPITAIMLGLGTILFPFSTTLFSHVFSATLGFAAYLLLRRERARGPTADRRGGLMLGAAGLLCGYSISTEYPLGLLVVGLAVFALWRRQPVRAALWFGTGLLIGLLPLLAYDWWAFGSPFRLSYMYVAANDSGVLGLGLPKLASAVKLLASDRGLFVVTPVMAAGVGGIVVLYREGRRLDALATTLVAAAYFIYNSGYYLPFGGSVPGPRFLITMLPFFAVPLAAAYRRAPLTTVALAAISGAIMATATITLPILSTSASTRVWFRMLENGVFTTRGISVETYFAFLALSLIAVAVATRLPKITWPDGALAAFAVGGWYALRTAGPVLVQHDVVAHDSWGVITLVVMMLALATVGTFLARGHKLALLAGVPLVALALPSLDHVGIAIALAAGAVALAAGAVALGSVLRRPHPLAL
jgi:hypothetical protein